MPSIHLLQVSLTITMNLDFCVSATALQCLHLHLSPLWYVYGPMDTQSDGHTLFVGEGKAL